MALHRRLLQDIAEIEQKPYPNIKYIPFQDDITKACLILTPDGYAPLHLKVSFTKQYPLVAPKVTIQSSIDHPNVFGNYICATILNTTEGWTSAYTLKGICIQLLSFFGSDSLEQDHGGAAVDLRDYKDPNHIIYPMNHYACNHCDFANIATCAPLTAWYRPPPPGAEAYSLQKPSRKRRRTGRKLKFSESETSCSKDDEEPTVAALSIKPEPHSPPRVTIADLPDEILVVICSHLETEKLIPFSRSWNRIGSEHGIVTKFNIVRNRELICFTLKRGFEELNLGVGVHIQRKGRIGSFESEFDLLSQEAFEKHQVRTAVQGNAFEHWLPLAISRRHYNNVKPLVEARLKILSDKAGYPIQPSFTPEKVIYGFMSDIVVRLSQTAENISTHSRSTNKSTLSHASEKAIESYYHLFHLLLCIATDDPRIVRDTNRNIKSFLDGNTSKHHVPNLGHLLIAVLISDADMTKDLLMAIIRETITRNVVWMLDKRGANMPELAYIEANPVSTYRLQKTFDASLTSYRLLMFQNTFRRTIQRGTPIGQKSLIQIRDELFDAHGAPPLGTAAKLANDVRQLQQVKTFPQFLTIMGLKPPSAREFTSFLRRSLEDSVKAGYSVWGISQERALTLRQQLDPEVMVNDEPRFKKLGGGGKFELNFFPGKQRERGGRFGGR